MKVVFPENYDPDDPACFGGIFGLPSDPDRDGIRLLPVPFEATCSYGRGTAQGPGAILRASGQLDLIDPHFGKAYECGIHMDPPPALIPLPEPTASEEANRKAINEASAARTAAVSKWTAKRMEEGKLIGIVGGDHSCPLGAISICSDTAPLSILHIDAHMDLRPNYEGHEESHASIMHQVLSTCPGVTGIVQLGIRDYSAGERNRSIEEGDRVHTCFMHDWQERMLSGTPFATLAHKAISLLSSRVWVSFDVDGLDPSLCPRTGTPVPGGFDYWQAGHILKALSDSGREVAGFDLCEVFGTVDECQDSDPTRDSSSSSNPSDSTLSNSGLSSSTLSSSNEEWDANVGARILYKLCGLLRKNGRTGS